MRTFASLRKIWFNGQVQPDSATQTVIVSDLTNQQFLEKYAAAGRIGLSGGPTLVDKAIYRAERHLNTGKEWGSWSHAFLFQGLRRDGHHWVIESDLQIHHKHIQLGVQENRISKYFDDKVYDTLAVLDFGLAEPQVANLLGCALSLVAERAKYSLRELLGTLIALKHPDLRGRDNLMARERSMYCSAFIQHLFQKMDLQLAPGVHGKNTTPEDIWRTALPHVRHVLRREETPTKLEVLRKKLRRRVRARIRHAKLRVAEIKKTGI
jgi:hypothetical protein